MSTTEPIKTPLIEHLKELRKRVVWAVLAWLMGFAICYAFVEPIYAFLAQPLADSFAADATRRLIYTSLAETFLAYLSLAFYAGFFVAFPLIAAQFYLFLAPGLYQHEKRVLVPYLILSPLLFFAGAALAYYGVIPLAWEFFVGFEASDRNVGLPIELEAKVSDYLALVIQLLAAFGLAFQLPIVLTLLARVGMVGAAMLRKGRRYAVVIILIAAAILTPPDVLSQIGLFIPLYLLYELSILAVASIEKKRAAREQEELADARY